MDREVDQERARIDRIDERILRLLNQRARAAQRIGQRKAKHGADGANGFWVPSREKRIFDRLRELNTGPLSDEAIRAVFREIISASRALEARLTVAYLGPEGTFPHAAARDQFGGGPLLAPAFLGGTLLLFANALSAFATIWAWENQIAYIVPQQISIALSSEVGLSNVNVADLLALGMVALMAIVMTGYALLQRRAARWLR